MEDQRNEQGTGYGNASLDWSNGTIRFNNTFTPYGPHMIGRPDTSIKTLMNISANVRLYFIPVIIAVGLIGNTLLITVFSRTVVKKWSISHYLVGIGVSDTGFLVPLFMVWLRNFKVDIIAVYGVCRLFMYITYIASFLSMWYVAAATVERFISLWFPLKRSMCTAKRSRCVTITLAVLAILFYSFAVWTSGVYPMHGVMQCSVLPKFAPIISFLHHVDTVIVSIIPTIAVGVLNVLNVVGCLRLRSQIRKRRNYPNEAEARNEMKMQYEISRLFTIISVTCWLIGLPLQVSRTLFLFKTLNGEIPTHRNIIMQGLLGYLIDVCYGIKFFIAIVCSGQVRKGLVAYFKGCRRCYIRRKYERAEDIGEPMTCHTTSETEPLQWHRTQTANLWWGHTVGTRTVKCVEMCYSFYRIGIEYFSLFQYIPTLTPFTLGQLFLFCL